MWDVLTRAGCYIAIIILGYVLRKKGFFGENAFEVLSKIVLRITLPAAVIASSSGKTIDGTMLAVIGLGLGCGLLYMLIAFLLNLKSSKEQRAFEVLNTPSYSIGTFALPFTQSFLGPVGMVTTSLFDVGNAFIALGGGYGVAATIKAGKGFSWKRILMAPLKTIPFLAHLLMTFLNLNDWVLPGPLLSLAQIIGNANAFMAMLMIGVGFNLSGKRSQIGRILRILLVRYGVAAILAVVFYRYLPFDLEVRKTLVLLVFSPIGSAIPVFTAELKEDVGLSSALNSMAIICSIIIMVILLVVLV